MTHSDILKKLETIKYNNKTLKDLNIIKSILIAPDGVVDIKLDLNSLDLKSIKDIKLLITKAIKLELGFSGLRISEAGKLENKIVSDTKQGDDFKKYNYLAIISGKGGVGKSTVAINIARAFKKMGYNIGLIDSDIYGASVPDYLGIEKLKVYGNEESLNPILTLDGIEVISARFLLDDKKPLIWRAPMLSNILDYFFKKVNWDSDNDLIIIDMPPGTGDVLLDVAGYAKDSIKAILVTTPDINASKIALKSGMALADLGISILGVVENMTCIYNTNITPFGSGGGEYVSSNLEKELLYKMPLFNLNNKAMLDEFLKLAKIIDKKMKVK